MTLDYRSAVANGISTDHPIPDLPFVDDSHIPLQDPLAVEAIGRIDFSGTWGRHDDLDDYEGQSRGWVVFTTDAGRTDLAWVVRWHPEHGRSVALYRDSDSASMHSDFTMVPTLLLYRAGGYWWDGDTWFRPLQVWDRATERFVRRPVPGARSVSAAELLQGGGDASRAQLLTIEEVDAEATLSGRWIDHLALWAAHRPQRADVLLPLDQCVINVSAPELTGDQLIGVAEMADIAEVAASTLRAYISRGEGDVPLHQATVSGRSAWARPVAEEWAERRRHSTATVVATVASDPTKPDSPPTGIADMRDYFTNAFYSRLWENPNRRKQWALRWRTQENIRATAVDLASTAAASIPTLVPTGDIGVTVRHAILGDFAVRQLEYRQQEPAIDPSKIPYFVMPHVAKTLDWLIRHHPRVAIRTIGETVGEAERKLGMDRTRIENTLRTALNQNGKLRGDALDDFLSRAFSPAAT